MNFQIDLGEGAVGGFSDVSGLALEKGDAARHSDITLKRGVISSKVLFTWLKSRSRRDVTLVLLGESRNAVARWKLNGALPLKYTGPSLSGKGTGDLAIEELVLSCEGLVNLRD